MNNFINVRLEAYNHNKTLNAIKHNIRHIQSKSERLNFDNMSKDRIHNNSNYFIFDGIAYPMKKNKADTKEYYNYCNKYPHSEAIYKARSEYWLAPNLLEFKEKGNIVFASVGAGMNINALVYRFP